MPGMDEKTAELILSIREDAERTALLAELADGGDTAEVGESADTESLLSAFADEGIVEIEGSTYELTDFGERVFEYATRDWNPSNEGTKRAATFETLSDCEWHCSACELPSSQPAKDIQMLRKEGFEFVQNTGQGQGDYRHCETCENTTFHRKLKYPFPTQKSITRQDMPDSFKRRVRDLYDHRDAFDGSSPSTTLEVDHRVPEVRWDESESFDYESMSDEDVREHFQILSRKHNLLKSRKCEACVESGKRPTFFEIDYYYEGGEEYDEDVGCVGCGWYNPHEWRAALQEELDGDGSETPS
ncbi:hypothetical protein [Halobellus inordinatus]|uniref:hypothetical protein n=1 Tax=Halobellus inordinatus TaxID=1126236 RepID=UPI00210B96BC|nr:hypothetical protein [Halobellus inordinatus]